MDEQQLTVNINLEGVLAELSAAAAEKAKECAFLRQEAIAWRNECIRLEKRVKESEHPTEGENKHATKPLEK